MSFIPTRIWLKRLIDQTMKEDRSTVPKFARLMNHFPEMSPEEWLAFLNQQGMLPVKKNTVKDWETWLRATPSKGIRELESQLQLRFQGPDTDIFLFPIDVKNKVLMDVMNGKNGITYPEFILLFFKEDIEIKEKQALLIHEYHHVCRLHHQEQNNSTVTLLESLIMEGLAEYEVKRMLGKKYVSDWMTLYSDKQMLDYWKRGISVRRNMKGRKNQMPFLFGGSYGYPKWIGYCIGYRMVESYLEEVGDKDTMTLLKTSPEEIWNGSIFQS